MKKYFQSFRASLAVIISIVFLAVMVLFIHLFTPVSFEDKWKEVQVPEGVTYSQGITILINEGMIRNKLVFLVLGRITKIDRKLRAGFYKLSTSMTPYEIFDRLRKGRVLEFMITIPEGSDLNDIRMALKANSLIDDASWKIVRDREFLRALNIDAPSLEGYLFPETYLFAKGTSPKDIFATMVDKMREGFDQTLKRRAEELGMNENTILTLASIIEKEAAADEERPLVSAVLHNRLKKNMRLQMDPTVIYGVKRMGEVITREDLKKQTPYNTYVIDGLPPGPISSPGIKSIQAALYPAKTDYLFFVSRNDGRHHFSSSNKEHEKAVQMYQRGNKDTSGEKDNNKIK